MKICIKSICFLRYNHHNISQRINHFQNYRCVEFLVDTLCSRRQIICYQIHAIQIKSPDRIMKNAVLFIEEIQLQMKWLPVMVSYSSYSKGNINIMVKIRLNYEQSYLANWNVLQMMFRIQHSDEWQPRYWSVFCMTFHKML